jgi:hypothetical protein
MMYLERRRRREREIMLAQLTAAVVNSGICRPGEPVSTRDYMPSEWAKQAAHEAVPESEELAEQRRQEIANAFRRWAKRNAAN